MTNKNCEVNRVIEILNEARGMELCGITQYMNHHYGLDDADYGKLAKAMKRIAIDEMKHAEAFAERIKDIDSTREPITDIVGTIIKGQKVDAIYTANKNAEDETIRKYNEFAGICRENNDTISATLFERIIIEEQEHLNYFDDTANHIKELGNSFLARQTGNEKD
jgi:bacterioferritin